MSEMEAFVLGAGMVGVATALALQERGHAVTLIDRREPGRETSFGNGGMIQCEAAEPYPFPRKLGVLLSIVLGRSNAVRWTWTAAPSNLRPVASYFLNSARARHAKIAAIYAQLTSVSTQDHAPLIEASNAANLIQRSGYRVAFRSARTFDTAAEGARRMKQLYGVRSAILSADALASQEPGLLRRLAGAVHWLDTWSCSDPGLLVSRYAGLFTSRGGRICTGDALTLTRKGHTWTVTTDDGPVSAATAVVALGPWSATLLARFGVEVPLFRKRGYHQHYDVANGPTTPLLDADNAAFCAPMRQGLRIATGAELTRPGAQPSPVQLRRAEASVAELFALGAPRPGEPWFGDRPCLPDMLPVLGPVPSLPGLWTNFGHAHQGFTMGPTTGRLLADLIDGEDRCKSLTDRLGVNRFLQ